MSIGWAEKSKKLFIIIGLIVGYVLFIKYVFPVMWPLIIGFIIAKVISPLVSFLKKHLKMADGIASAIILTLVTGIVCGVLILAGIGAYRWAHGIIINRDHYEQMAYNYLDNMFYQVEETFDINHGVIMAKATDILENGMDKLVSTAFDKSMGNGADVVKQVINIFIAGIVLYACTVLLAKDMNQLNDKMMKNDFGREVLNIYENVKRVIWAYLKAQVVIMIINAIICSVALLTLGVKNGLIIGLIVGLLDGLPMIGVGVIFIPWSIVCLFLKDYFMAVVLFLVFVVCNIVRELLEPKLMGDKIGIHPVATLAAIFAGYNLFGIIGFVLGPVGFIIIKTVYQKIDKEVRSS